MIFYFARTKRIPLNEKGMSKEGDDEDSSEKSEEKFTYSRLYLVFFDFFQSLTDYIDYFDKLSEETDCSFLLINLPGLLLYRAALYKVSSRCYFE